MWFSDKIRESLFNLGWQEYRDGRFDRQLVRFTGYEDGQGKLVVLTAYKHKDGKMKISIEYMGIKKNEDGTWKRDDHIIFALTRYCNMMREAINEAKEHNNARFDNHHVDGWEWGVVNVTLDELSALDWSVEEK